LNSRVFILSTLIAILSGPLSAADDIRIDGAAACRKVMPVVGASLDPKLPPKEQPDGKKKKKEGEPPVSEPVVRALDSVEISPDVLAKSRASAITRAAKEELRREVLEKAGALLREDFTGMTNARILRICMAYGRDNKEMWKGNAQERNDAKFRDGYLSDARVELAKIGVIVPDFFPEK